MLIEELFDSEKNLIDILRNFRFLAQNRYYETELLYYVRAYPSVEFYNSVLKQKISIIGSDYGCLMKDYSIVFERKRFFSYKVFAVSDYYETFGSTMMKERNYTLKSQSEFIQKHLMPVVRGEMWIDELIKQQQLIF